MTSADYLSRPYARRLTPDESGGYVATIQEFPGLVAEGDTAEEALSNLESAAKSWIDACIETGRDIPEPIDFGGYSGKIALRIPRGLHKRAAEMALSEGASLNLWLTGAISHYLGGHDGLHLMARNLLASMPSTINFTNDTSLHITNVHITKIPPPEGITTGALSYFGSSWLTANAMAPRAITYWGGDNKNG
jgi:predicted RNase H-like HicB family nuclease